MHYIPNLSQMEEMLSLLGMKDISELFDDIPSDVRIDGLDLPPGMSEPEVWEELHGILEKNVPLQRMPSFLGGGIYRHAIPPMVGSLIGRSEFETSYTPYQSELSQGMLQSLWEFQSAVAELFGMEGANTSMYDGPTALGEAALMAARISKKSEIIIPEAIHWEKKSVLRNYTRWIGMTIKEVAFEPDKGTLDLTALEEAIGPQTAGVYLENPNIFGVFEPDVKQISDMLKDTLMIVGVNPMSLGLVRSPGDYGADIAIAEGQPLGNPLSYGGPHVGFFGCKKRYIRQMPGRVIGLTKDTQGKRAFCMTLQTREQHIRREKATSNICTNQALCAVASLIHLSSLGPKGLEDVGRNIASKAKYLAREIQQLPGFKAPLFDSHHFNEFVVGLPRPSHEINERLLGSGVHGGISLKEHFPTLGDSQLLAVTELTSSKDMERLFSNLGGVV